MQNLNQRWMKTTTSCKPSVCYCLELKYILWYIIILLECLFCLFNFWRQRLVKLALTFTRTFQVKLLAVAPLNPRAPFKEQDIAPASNRFAIYAAASCSLTRLFRTFTTLIITLIFLCLHFWENLNSIYSRFISKNYFVLILPTAIIITFSNRQRPDLLVGRSILLRWTQNFRH